MEGHVEGAGTGAAGLRWRACRCLKASGKPSSLEFKAKVRDGWPGLNPAPCQGQAPGSHVLSTWGLEALGGGLGCGGAGPRPLHWPLAGSRHTLPVVTTLFSVQLDPACGWGFRLRHVRDRSVMWAPGRACPPARPPSGAPVNYRSRHPCSVTAVAPRDRTRPGERASAPAFVQPRVRQPSAGTYGGTSQAGHPGRVRGVRPALPSPSPRNNHGCRPNEPLPW